jgi:RNA recognition motif-containing protein
MNNNMMSMMMINSTDFFQSLPSSLDHNLSSLFLGDLSIYSTEKDIRQLFKNYGVIETVRIKRGSSGKPHLSYGFIKFRDRESAERALRELNGTVFLGRALRLGWAEPKSNTKVLKSRKDAKPTETAQIHVSFISKQVNCLISSM